MRSWNSSILAVSAAVIVASLVSCGSESGRAPATTTGVSYITVDQSSGSESLVLRTPAGQTVRIQDGSASVIEIADAGGNSITLKPDGIVINSSAKVTVQASAVDVTASTVNVNAGMSKFSGVVQADTLIANSVVSSSYTPGAGNTW